MIPSGERDRPVDSGSAFDSEPEITREMIEAGVYVAREHPLGQSLDDLVVAVFAIMSAAAKSSPVRSDRGRSEVQAT